MALELEHSFPSNMIKGAGSTWGKIVVFCSSFCMQQKEKKKRNHSPILCKEVIGSILVMN